MRCFSPQRACQPHRKVMEREGWKTAVGKSCGQAGNLGNLQVPSCRSHTVSSSRFSISSYSHTLQCVPSGLGNPRMYFGAKRRLEAPEGLLQDSSWSCWSTHWGMLQGPAARQ